ncbi:bifunctional 4-hydroxy-2-oxoglutarate aldolase/2-dehydro-3-deoxy-phosphogluconate aldolase [Flavobacterium sp. Fl-318]|uniref:Bifunctional 4-hydroxy-2-oxoglutarate aldolase/2-dehydro-3-deoxy-phosphogluconate aldolase n=1 Tax=Flavobacterium cupriresistens TaxID=2893885 RepID=A0ABU4RGQ3_9FLAO|nr:MULTISPECIES: bifunctional 4-hydroxy-2-oxoglutarate aldolase/2-dehydro-3-deoxy-phosphogluconate aldolase [unclassified Flavobacterium]MDX6191751.1 bifunctional 4-hydroxy-2-oxoglutarate aldolase/2-dehydro-3-deoxy-phosphogluconate aldolase [Flavobacterium sp. Fl-318]UFH41694.1 bifunctional 4-hydroxy-2-oxoglutarate aldolase/2-dehydro-3-deoxy-phosphogluconate aldolase [Flavobacterium sp. F-323]
MSTIQNSIDVIVKQGILPLYFNTDENKSIEILRVLYKSGIKAVEYTNRGPEAASNFKKMIEVRNAEMPEMLLGIGTIKNMQQAEEFCTIGADFFVSPGFVAEVSDFLKSKDILYAPGCMTPTEIITAENAGVKFVKLFPGNILGPDFLSGIKDIFPSLIFMPTGGVETTLQSIQSWFTAGVSAVGMGSKLISKKVMEHEAYDTIEKETVRVLSLIETVRNK